MKKAPKILSPSTRQSPTARTMTPALGGPAGLSLWPASTCLISELADELLNLPPQAWRHLTIILPTRRLQNWLLALLSDKVPAFVPPRFFNFDEFVQDLAKQLAPEVLADATTEIPDLPQFLAHGALDPLSEEFLIAGLLRHNNFRHLKPGHEHEIRQLFAELAENAAIDNPYERLRTLIAADYVHCEESLASLAARVDELESLHREYLDACRQGGVISAATLRTATANAVAHVFEQTEADHITSMAGAIYLVGFTSIAPCHDRLLRCLAKTKKVAIWLSEAPVTPGESAERLEKNPLSLLRAYFEPQIGSNGFLHRRPQNQRSQLHEQHRVRLHSAATPLIETSTALTLVKQALESGIPASQIAVLITSDSAYGPLLRCLLKDQTLPAPVNMAVTTPLSQSSLGTWLRTLFDLLSGEEETGKILDFLTQEHTLSWLRQQKDFSNNSSKNLYNDNLKASLVHEICRCGIDRSLHYLAAHHKLPTHVRTACALVMQVIAPLKAPLKTTLKFKHSLETWNEHLVQLLSEFQVLGDTSADSSRPGRSSESSEDEYVEQSARAAAQTFIDALAIAARQHRVTSNSKPFGLGEFITLIRDKMLAQEIRDVGDQLYGVQVLSVEEARYVPFRYVIILGATEGQFPQALPQDRLLDNSLKSRIGLPGWQLREAIEDTTFHLLLSRLPALEIFYPQRSNGAETVRSRFVERLLLQRDVTLMTYDGDSDTDTNDSAVLHFLKSSQWETHGQNQSQNQGSAQTAPLKTPAPGSIGPGLRQDIKNPLSASALEKLLTCPYRFLLDRLGHQALSLPEADDAMTEGDWLHQILEVFFTDDPKLAEPLKLDLSWEGHHFEHYVVERLTHLTERLAPEHVRDTPIYLELMHRAWPAFATHLKRLYSPKFWRQAVAGLREQALHAANGGALELKLDDLPEPLQLRGYIDSIDFSDQVTVITDYKRRGMPSPTETRRGIAPQLWLYAYALSAMNPHLPLKQMVLGYWSILKGSWQPLGAGSEALASAKARGLVSERAKPLETIENEVKSLWNWRLTQLQDPDKPLLPDTTHCGFCEYAGVCRKDDPKEGPLIAHSPESLRHFLSARGLSEGDA